MTYTQTGRLVKMTGGLYTVRLDSPTPDAPSPLSGAPEYPLAGAPEYPLSGVPEYPLAGALVECRARGQFRHARITPLVGDRVTVQYDHTSYERCEDGTAVPSADRTGLMIVDILPRKNCLIRPPLANVDTMLCVVAAASPDPDIPTIDKLLCILEFNRIEPVMVVGKCELDPARAAELKALYEQAGYRVFVLSCRTGEGLDAFCAYAHATFGGRITAVAGASGAGKSTLLNTAFPGLGLVTGTLSEKIGRGKNTTRHTELFDLTGILAPADSPPSARGYIADTAGFSLLDFERFDFFGLDDLAHTFREFRPCLSECRYTDCTHTTDEGCAVVQAVREGKIPASRHAAYRDLYAVLKEKKKW